MMNTEVVKTVIELSKKGTDIYLTDAGWYEIIKDYYFGDTRWSDIVSLEHTQEEAI